MKPALLTLEADAGSTVLGSDDPLSDTEQNHSHTDVKAEKKHISIIPEEEGRSEANVRRKGFGQRRAEREKAVIILRLQISALIMLRS